MTTALPFPRALAATLALAAMAIATPSFADCPPLSVYQVSGVTLRDGTLTQAASMLFSGTAWTVHTDPAAANLRVSLSGVGGPLDKVLNEVLTHVGRGKYAVGSVNDAQACTVHITVTSLAPPPAAVAVKPTHLAGTAVKTAAAAPGHFTAPAVDDVDPLPQTTPAQPVGYTLPAGAILSHALATYVKSQGWTLRWNLSQDYVLDAPFPIPAGDSVVEGVRYVLRAYKAQGGLLDAAPHFWDANHVVEIQPMQPEAKP